MVILDYPYISDDMCATLAERRIPVLRNPAAEACAERHVLNLVDDQTFVARLKDGSRLYLNSENALSWVLRHDSNPERVRGIGLMKDKHALRQALRPMYPEYHFAQYTFEELRRVDPAELRFPLVLKPSVGFFSVGVFVVNDAAGWAEACRTLGDKLPEWRAAYPDGVLGDVHFSVEEYIHGDEYAIDAYYDGQGKAVILNVMKHEFADASDVRDRLYCLYPGLMARWTARFAEYLDRVGEFLNLRDFPFHVEVRVAGEVEDGVIVPIEFNPLRFAGCCTTDLARHAFGIRTWLDFLDDRRPDWNAIAANGRDDIYSLIMLDKPDVPLDGMRFDYQALRGRLTEVLDERSFGSEMSAFGYIFARTPGCRWEELDAILRSDLTEFLCPTS